MSTSWIKDKVVAVAEAQAAETGEDAEEIIWQLSKELGKMVRIGKEIIGNLDTSQESIDAFLPAERINPSAVNITIESDVKSGSRLERVQKISESLRAEQSPFTPKFKTGDEPEFQERKKAHFDDISKPAHYAEGRRHEPKDVIRDWGLNFNLGSATKYISRCGRKDDAIQELRKAITFIQFEIDARLEEEGNGAQE